MPIATSFCSLERGCAFLISLSEEMKAIMPTPPPDVGVGGCEAGMVTFTCSNKEIEIIPHNHPDTNTKNNCLNFKEISFLGISFVVLI